MFQMILEFINFDCAFLKGNMADPRMRSAAKRRGVEITSLSRPIKASDFREFDLILAMDEQNRGSRPKRVMIAVIF